MEKEHHGIVNRVFTGIIRFITIVALVYGLFGVGYLVCTTPQATDAVGHNFANWDSKVFPEDDMAALAEAVRSYSIEGTERTQLLDTVKEVVERAYPELEVTVENDTLSVGYGGLLSGLNETFAQFEGTSMTDRLSFPLNALQHLEDCTPIFQMGRNSVYASLIAALIGLVLMGLLRGRRSFGRTMIIGAVLVVLIIGALAAWALLDFNSMFTMMHQVLFSQGNWTFAADSLLIQLFPEAFWLAMAILWAVVSGICALFVLIVGIIVK